MGDYPYKPVPVKWKRPPVDKDVLKGCTERSDVQGLLHSLGTLAILAATGSLSYTLYATGHWVWMALALYGLFKPFLHNTRRSVWHRYVYDMSKREAQRDVYWTQLSQFLFHVGFAIFAIAIGSARDVCLRWRPANRSIFPLMF